MVGISDNSGVGAEAFDEAGTVAALRGVQLVALANSTLPADVDVGDSVRIAADLKGQLYMTSLATGTADSAAPSQTIMVGALANASAPTPDEGDLASLSVTLTSELRTRLDLAQAASGSAVPSQMVAVGLLAKSTVPTAVDDGDLVAPNGDLYGHMRLAGYDYDVDAGRVVDVAPAVSQKLGPLTFTQLTAAGSTAATNVSNYKHLTWQIVVASIDTSVDVRIEGSLDNSSWFNMDDSGSDTQYTANGTYMLRASDRAVKFVRFTFVSEVGGTAVTLDVKLMAGN